MVASGDPPSGEVSVNRSMLTMTAGATYTDPLLNHFDDNGTAYGRQAAQSLTGWPETTDVRGSGQLTARKKAGRLRLPAL